MKLYGNFLRNISPSFHVLFAFILYYWQRAFVNPFYIFFVLRIQLSFFAFTHFFTHDCSVLLSTLNHNEKCTQSTKLSSLFLFYDPSTTTCQQFVCSNVEPLFLFLLHMDVWDKNFFFVIFSKALLWSLSHTSHACRELRTLNLNYFESIIT